MEIEDWQRKKITLAVAFSIAYLIIVNIIVEPLDLPQIVQFILLTLLPVAIISWYVGKLAFKDGISKPIGLFILILALDLLMVDHKILTNGEYATESLLYGASIDVQVANIWSWIGIHGELLYILTYLVAPIISLLISTFLLSEGEIDELL